MEAEASVLLKEMMPQLSRDPSAWFSVSLFLT